MLQCCFSGNNKAGHVFNPFQYFLPIMPLFTAPVESLELPLTKDFSSCGRSKWNCAKTPPISNRSSLAFFIRYNTRFLSLFPTIFPSLYNLSPSHFPTNSASLPWCGIKQSILPFTYANSKHACTLTLAHLSTHELGGNQLTSVLQIT